MAAAQLFYKREVKEADKLIPITLSTLIYLEKLTNPWVLLLLCKRVDYEHFYPCNCQPPQDFFLTQTCIACPGLQLEPRLLPNLSHQCGQLGASCPSLFRILCFIVHTSYQNLGWS